MAKRAIPDFPIVNPKSPRWRASLIQNSNLVENYLRSIGDETCNLKIRPAHALGDLCCSNLALSRRAFAVLPRRHGDAVPWLQPL